MAAARYLRLWRCWRPGLLGGLAPLAPARRRVYAACSSASPWALWAPRGPAPSPAPLAGLSVGPRRHLRGPGSLGGGDELASGGAEDGGGSGADPAGAPPAMTALTPLLIPERFPNVPLIAVTRNPVFPRFIKILEVKNKKLVELLRRKVRLAQPYAGVFLKKDDNTKNIHLYQEDSERLVQVGVHQTGSVPGTGKICQAVELKGKRLQQSLRKEFSNMPHLQGVGPSAFQGPSTEPEMSLNPMGLII